MVKRTSRGFADKIAKSSHDFRKHCPVCGEAIEMVKHIIPVKDETTDSISFKERMVGVCNCNRSAIYQ